MNMFTCALFALVLAGVPGTSPPERATTLLVFDSLEELKADVAAAQKEAAPTEEQAIEFSTRALDIATDASDAATRAGALGVSFGLRFRDKSAELDKLRGELWDIVIDKDADDAALIAPLVLQYPPSTERTSALAKRSKSPEVKSACAYVPLNAQFTKKERNEKETKELLAALKSFRKEFGQVMSLRHKKPWSEVCEGLLFQLENLSIGCVVPEIEATDTSGVSFKLSDYRGKVVLLDFWGFW